METNNTYEIDDIVCFHMWKRPYVGRIKKFGYTVIIEMTSDMIIPLEECARFKYEPCHHNEEWYEDMGYDEDIKGNFAKVLYVGVEERKIKFSLKREDRDHYFQAKTDGERFKLLLRGLWKNLVVRKVKTVVLPSNALGVTKYRINTKYGMLESDMLLGKSGKTFEERYAHIDMTETDDTFFAKYYSSYFGFTFKFGNNDQEIYFHKDNYRELDFDVDKSCQFGNWANHLGGHRPPLRGNFVCGIVKKNEKGLYYDDWFACSPQFFNLWKFIMSNKAPKGMEIDRLLQSVQDFTYDRHLTEEQRKAKLESYKVIAKNSISCVRDSHLSYGPLIKYMLTNENPPRDSNAADIVYNLGKRA